MKLPKAGIIVVLLILMVCLIPQSLCALDPEKEIYQYNTEVYLTEHGLPQSSILSIVQTSDGYIWLGTYEGLARFDGIQFKVFDTSNTPEMKSDRVRVMHEDSRGILWIGTYAGLLRYKDGYFKNYTTKDGLSNDFILSIAEDHSGVLWIGTREGLNRFADNTFKTFTRKDGLSRDYISALAVDRRGTVWIGTSHGGMHIYRDFKITHCTDKWGLTGQEDIRVLLRCRGDGVWAGIRGSGLICIKDGKTKFFTEKDGLSGSDVRALYEDLNHVLWIGTNGSGLNRYKKGVFTSFSSDQGLLNRPIRSFAEDPEGSLWIGTRDGLCQMKDGKFVLYNKRNGLPVDSVRTVFEDSEKNIWLGTVNGGLVKIRNNQFKIFRAKDGLLSEHIWTITESGDGSIWLGTYGGGLHQLKNDKILRVYTAENGLSNNVIRAVMADGNGNLWIGTNGGGIDVLNIDSRKIINYNKKSGLSDDYVYALAKDKQNGIWIGHFNGTLNYFKGNRFETYSQKNGLPGTAIWSIFPDKNGSTWIGTDGGGLVRFKDNNFTTFTMKDGLCGDLAFQVVEDPHQQLWMNCNRGIYSVKKQHLHDYAAGKINTIPCRSFGKTEGIKSTECSGPALPAGIFSSDGKLWFPTVRGVVVISPGQAPQNNAIPPVIIEQVRADNEILYTYPIKRENIKLEPGNYRLEFDYTGLSYVEPGQVVFKYMLENYDEGWQEAGNHRSVSYTHIPPGDYTFLVAAANNDGVWNKTAASFSFRLKPFFYQTLWFRFLAFIAFAFFSYWLINFIKKHMRLIAFWRKKKFIGSYEIEDQIGSGGMGIIYRVHSLMDRSRVYAMKVMKEELLPDQLQKKRFKNESLLVDSIDHPNSVKVYERGEHNEMMYIVMELLEGHTLAERFREGNYPTIAQAIHIMAQIADVLVALGEENIIHRDLKPENIILVEKDGDPDFVKLFDFGIARIQTFSHLTESGQVLGTLPFMPPEVIADADLSPAVDVYSLGVLGYIMLTGREPFLADNPMDTMRKIVSHIPPPPVELNPSTPPTLNGLIMKMFEKAPEYRPTAAEVHKEIKKLEDFLEDLKKTAPI